MPDKTKKNEMILMAGIMALFFLAAMIHATIAVMLPFFIDEYRLDPVEQGFFGTAESVGFLISLFVMAEMMRRLQKKRLLLIMACVMSVVLLGVGLKPAHFLLLLGCYAVFGVSYGIVDSLASSLMADLFPEESGKKMSYMRAVYCLGGMLAPVLLSKLLENGLEWNKVVLMAGALSVLIAVFYVLFTSPRIPETEAVLEDRITFSNFRAFLFQKGAIRVILFGMMYYGHQIGLTIWIVRYITHYLKEPTWGSYALTFYWVGALLSRLTLPNFFRQHRKLLLFGSLSAALWLSIGILSGSGLLMCLMVFMAGFSEGSTVPMMVDYACSLDRRMSTTACSAMVFFDNIGSMFIPAVIGAMISASGARIGFLVLPLTSLVCAFLAAGMKKT